jgi:hypothetical protein
VKVILTVKLKPSEPGEIFDPYDVAAVIKGYQGLREDGTLGQKDFVTLRFLIEGNQGVEEIELPEAIAVPVENQPVIEQ